MQDRITIIGGGAPSIPENFRTALRALDPSLLVTWNPGKRRFVIEQCVQHLAPTTEHTHLCGRVYVYLVQDPEGNMMGLGDAVLQEIRRRDVSRSGYGPDDLQKWTRDMQTQLDAARERIEKQQADSVHHASRFNRRQLLRAIHLMQQHSMQVNQ